MDTSACSPCSSPLHADVPRYLPHVWAHVSLAPGVPRGLGFLRHPPTVAYPVDTSAPGGLFRGARHGVTPFRPSVWRGTEDPPLRRVARECRCVGCRPAQPISVPLWPSPIIRVGYPNLTTILTWVPPRLSRMQLGSMGFPVGCRGTTFYPCFED